MPLGPQQLLQAMEVFIHHAWSTNKPLSHSGGLQDYQAYQWQLLTVASGRVRLVGGPHAGQHPGPVALLLTPGSVSQWQLPRGQIINRIGFTVRPGGRKLGPAKNSRAFSPIDPAPRQPSSTELFDVTFPAVLPSQLFDIAQQTATYCGQRWWRSALDHLRANHRLQAFLLDLLSWFIERPQGSASDDVIDRVIHETRLHIGSGLNTTDMAALVGMGRSAFHQRFTKATGVSPGEFLSQERLDRAERLLRQGMPIAEVAQSCGYRHHETFTRAFARKHGCPPRTWLQRYLADGQGKVSKIEADDSAET